MPAIHVEFYVFVDQERECFTSTLQQTVKRIIHNIFYTFVCARVHCFVLVPHSKKVSDLHPRQTEHVVSMSLFSF